MAAASARGFDVDGLIAKIMSKSAEAPPPVDYAGVDAGRAAPPPAVKELKEADLRKLCSLAYSALLDQPVLLEVQAPITICGDIHGQFYDLMRIFHIAGHPDSTNYLFLGDYVDRGYHSIEVITLLLCFRLKYPERFLLLRGNHETAAITRIYGFYDECKRRFSVKLWKSFCDVFNCLPIAAVVDNRIFCCHGGLSRDLKSFDQIRAIARPTDVPDTGLLCDLLWADPTDEFPGWGSNNQRGVSWSFGVDALNKFLTEHDLDLFCRAHEVKEDGYEFFGGRKLITVFSAPNYCLAEDMQILTEDGWMSLERYSKVWDGLYTVGFTPEHNELIWETPTRFILNEAGTSPTLIEISERYDWVDESHWGPGRISLRVTPEHTMLVKRGKKVHSIMPADFGTSKYEKVLARDLLTDNDQEVVRFMCVNVPEDPLKITMSYERSVELKKSVAEVPYTGKTWCVTMPHGHIVVRRVKLNADGEVLMSSKPTIVGNCNDFDNAGAILQVSADLVCSMKILKPINHPPLME